ncbi:MAG: hypothetical protein ABSA82_05295 [Thermacetogeniaceae bacterium]
MTIDYCHLKRLTDEGGMLQFSMLRTPDPDSGYTVDDNARALLVALNMEGEERRELVDAYIRFLGAAQRIDGGWHNWKLDGRFVTTIDSEDSQGRAFLSCCAASLCELEDVREAGRGMAMRALPVLFGLRSPRAVAYALLGICLNPGLSDRRSGVLAGVARDFSDYLIGLYSTSRHQGWQWFEEVLTYCNGILPHALFAYYSFAQDRKALRVARDTLGWLTDALFARGYLSIVGNRGWWRRGAEMPCYDQQPVDACSMALAYARAFRVTGDSQYRSLAELAYDWYRGNNINRISLYDAATGGCYDALTPEGVNLNQGAESLLSLLLSQQVINGMASTGQDAEIRGRRQEAGSRS